MAGYGARLRLLPAGRGRRTGYQGVGGPLTITTAPPQPSRRSGVAITGNPAPELPAGAARTGLSTGGVPPARGEAHPSPTLKGMRTPRPWALPQQPAGRAELLVPGVTRAMVATRIRTGDLLRVRPGVYLDAARWPTDEVARHLVRAHAEQVAHPGAALSHQSAALAWALPAPGLENWAEGPITLSLPRSGAARAPGPVVLHRPASLPAHHLTRDPDGYSITTLARTAVDLARGLDLPPALVLLDAAARRLCATMVSEPRRSDFVNPRLVRTVREMLGEAALACRAAALMGAVDLTEPVLRTPRDRREPERDPLVDRLLQILRTRPAVATEHHEVHGQRRLESRVREQQVDELLRILATRARLEHEAHR